METIENKEEPIYPRTDQAKRIEELETRQQGEIWFLKELNQYVASGMSKQGLSKMIRTRLKHIEN